MKTEKEYVVKCLKCDRLVYGQPLKRSVATTVDADQACEQLQHVISGHDLAVHGLDGAFPKFKIVRKPKS